MALVVIVVASTLALLLLARIVGMFAVRWREARQ